MHAIATQAFRNSDPATSADAADYMTSSGKRAAQQRIAATAVASYPGLTSLELAKRTGLCRFMLARRLPECETGGDVKRGQVRKCRHSARSAATWWPRDAVSQDNLFPRVA
jgi:CRP-like cAMP-binding protein